MSSKRSYFSERNQTFTCERVGEGKETFLIVDECFVGKDGTSVGFRRVWIG